jgi:chemotaxis protein methyltransferase CheR
VKGRWLEGDEDGMRIAPHIARAVQFRRVNLVDARELADLGKFDAIICRNVLIYFRDSTIEKVIGNLGDRLAPQGLLVVGASESLLRFNVAFACEELRGAFFYRKIPA